MSEPHPVEEAVALTPERIAELRRDDRSIMGTPQEAHDRLVEKTRVWRGLRRACIDTAAGHKKTAAAERETRFQLANAALFWLWHVENPEPAALNKEPSHG